MIIILPNWTSLKTKFCTDSFWTEKSKLMFYENSSKTRLLMKNTVRYSEKSFTQKKEFSKDVWEIYTCTHSWKNNLIINYWKIIIINYIINQNLWIYENVYKFAQRGARAFTGCRKLGQVEVNFGSAAQKWKFQKFCSPSVGI